MLRVIQLLNRESYSLHSPSLQSIYLYVGQVNILRVAICVMLDLESVGISSRACFNALSVWLLLKINLEFVFLQHSYGIINIIDIVTLKLLCVILDILRVLLGSLWNVLVSVPSRWSSKPIDFSPL